MIMVDNEFFGNGMFLLIIYQKLENGSIFILQIDDSKEMILDC